MEELYEKIKTLNERLWENRASRPAVDAWLANFADDSADPAQPSERRHALYLLSQFIYFADREVRELLRSLFRDYYRYPIIAELRKANNDTTDSALLEKAFADELRRTRFLGVGNPAESGTHLLYYFRQENRIPKDQFLAIPELFDRALSDSNVGLADPGVRRLVFIDDFCGSGNQAVQYSSTIIRVLRDIASRMSHPLHISYLVLAGRAEGLLNVRQNAAFDVVDAVLEFDASYKALSQRSRHFASPSDGIDLNFARQVAERYGAQLWAGHPLGYADGQLLLGFHHNIPDNTIPIIWWDEGVPPWEPMFKRYHKVYAGV